MAERGLVGGALACALAGFGACFALLDPEIRFDRHRGDVRGVAAGLEAAVRAPVLNAGPRALLHVHGVAEGTRLSAAVALRSAAVPVDLRVESAGVSSVIPVRTEPTWLRFTVPPGGEGLDVAVTALPRVDVPGRRPLYVVREIRLLPARPWRLRLALGATLLLGLAAYVGLVGRVGPRLALGAALVAAVLGAAALATLLEPILWLRFAPATRDVLRLLALGATAALALLAPASRALQISALCALAGILFFPSLGYGLVDDDFLWARHWTLADVASTYVGSEDPTGVSNAYYRPLASTSHALDHWLYGLWPPGYHLTNVALRAVTGIAALLLLARLAVGPLAALAGALVFVAHPLGASAVAWVSQRTDILLTAFLLAALACLAAEPFRRGHGLAALAFTLLALGSKEMAVTLPLVAFVLVWWVLPAEGRRARLPFVGAMALVVAAYVVAWAALFPDRFAARVEDPGRWVGFEPGSLAFWLRLVPGLLGPILVPTDYPSWGSHSLRDWSLAEVLAPLVAAGLGLVVARRGPAGRIAAFGLAWPFLVFWPILGLRTLDLYRLGLPLCFSAGLVAAAVVASCEARSRALAAAVAVALVLWLAPKTTVTTASWGPGGFYWEMMMRWRTQRPRWLDALSPASRALFLRQSEEREHVAGLLAP